MPHLLLLLIALAQAAPVGPGHDANPVYRDLVSGGLAVGPTKVSLPPPTLPDGGDPAAASAALRQVAGDDRAARELLRDSVTAPFVLKTRDIPAGDALVRAGDLWFVVHARLDDFDPERVTRQSAQGPVEAGNMRFESKWLRDEDLRAGEIEPLPAVEGRREWFTHLSGRLLDRISVEATDRIVATRTPDSIVIAARTEPAFGGDGTASNRWKALARQGTSEVEGPTHPYPGGISYVKVTRLASEPGALLVEAHFAFVEPRAWFQGNPILRSKIGVIAQDQIRRLRREIARAPAAK